MSTDHYFILGGVFYALAFLAGLLNNLHERRWLKIIHIALLAMGFASQTFALYCRGRDTHRCPIGDTFEMMQFISWSLMIIYAVVGSAFRISILGMFTAGLAAFLSGMGLVLRMVMGVPASERLPAAYLVEVHASLAFFSYGVFGMLALTSLMFLLQNWSLRHKRWRGVFGHLPSMAQLEHFNARLLFTSTAVFSAAMLVGSYWWNNHPDTLTPLKLIATVTVWGMTLIASGLRISRVLHGQRLAWVGICLFVAALLALYAVEANRMHPRATESSPINKS